ncbi:MAG: cyclic pyranopterin monophosphate synthase [Phycisphaerae bacterium]|nr:MAG: radical SAM protein [Planctomycetia bacterium]RIK71666.1 MAG: GTP 3',8-cyclase MoaA [Planctomycetota bacterium]GJQ25353.1 MAG: cyclic pyranopterin monophosphate synthase [Phycisphaerae bacterium]
MTTRSLPISQPVPTDAFARRTASTRCDDAPASLDRASPRPLIDGHARVIDHLRLSLTSACNLHCLYCRPQAAARHGPRDLSDDQRLDLIRFLHDSYGLTRLRLTGGEPLLHRSLVMLIDRIRSTFPALAIAMTTNGGRLKSMAVALRRAGLDRLNISLDSMEPATYRTLTGGRLAPVLDGIDAAVAAGFPPPRLNAVVLAGINDHQLPGMVSWAVQRGLELRLLEAMPIGPAASFNREHFVPARRFKDILQQHIELTPLPRHPGETAMRFAVRTGALRGTIGIIAPLSESFCGQCRRIRITADGRLFPCLLDSHFVDLAPCWGEAGFLPDEAHDRIAHAVAGKRATGPLKQYAAMVALGG